MGYEACLNAAGGSVKEGSVGAGTGATVGKFYGIDQAMKGGIGISRRRLKGGLIVGVLVVVNSFGDVKDPSSGNILAGARKSKRGKTFADTSGLYRKGIKREVSAFENTTLGVIITNAGLDKASAALVARLGQAGLAKVISPVHTIYDGDIVFTLASGQIDADPICVGVLAEEAIMEATARAITQAEGLGGAPSCSTLSLNPSY